MECCIILLLRVWESSFLGGSSSSNGADWGIVKLANPKVTSPRAVYLVQWVDCIHRIEYPVGNHLRSLDEEPSDNGALYYMTP